MRRVLSFIFGWCFIIVCVVFSIKSTALNPDFYIPKYEEMDLASDIVAQKLQEKYEAYSVDGGYVSIVMDKMNTNVSDDFCAQVERSIIKTYRRKIWSKFTKAIRDYELVKEGDCIAVCISGGKDSMLMAKCFQELHKHSPVHFDVK